MIEISIEAVSETWPLRDAFKISRGAKTEAHVVVATVSDGIYRGRGECVPYARYGESVGSVLADIERIRGHVSSRGELQDALPAGAARNAVDCAFWEFEANKTGRGVFELAGLPSPRPVVTAFTISLDEPDVMARKARDVSQLPLLKLKLGGAGDAERMRAVRVARPDARLIVDANEAWTIGLWPELSAAALAAGVEVIEQPFPTGDDGALRAVPRPVAVCADESAHTAGDLSRLSGLYDAVNIKLDKAGGLTEGLRLLEASLARGFKVMIGSMVATSLAAAPALLLAQRADWVDLDGPLLLKADREPGLSIRDGVIGIQSRVWG